MQAEADDGLLVAHCPIPTPLVGFRHRSVVWSGAPDSEYVVIEFETVFENKKTAIETVVTKMESLQ